MKRIYDKINLTAEQILAVSQNAPEKLFSGNSETARSEYHELSRRWHPDRNRHPQAIIVFQHIAELYRKTLELIKAGLWRGAGVLELPVAGSGATASARRQMNYFKNVKFELGDLYVAEKEVVFSVERQYADLFENARRHIADFRYADISMRKEIERNLPGKPQYLATPERLIMILPKTPDTVLLEDLLDYLGGSIDARHVGWMLSSLHNLACYFEYAGIVHHDISPHTFFVSPEFHSGMLLGGWWYARLKGEKINALPNRTINFAPPDVIRRKQADGRVDLELIRQTGRELLGVAHGAKMNTNGKIPPALARWINGATSGSAVTDYELWKNVLEMDFGKPRFVGLDVELGAVYGR
jgi:hypothetical protein